MRSTLSLMGLYRMRPDILDDFVLPSQINRTVFFDNLLMVTGEMEILYTNPDFLKGAIGAWSRLELANWEWLFSTQEYEYNPIWNVDVKDSERDDRKETRNLAGTNYETRNLAGTNNETRNLAGSETGTIRDDKTGTDTVRNYVSAYTDVSGNTQSNKQETTYNNSNLESRNLQSTDTGTDNYTSTDTGTDRFDSTDKGTIDHNDKHELWKRGNQGVTTTQQMIREEQELAKINFDDYIIEEFKKRFCLLVY